MSDTKPSIWKRWFGTNDHHPSNEPSQNSDEAVAPKTAEATPSTDVQATETKTTMPLWERLKGGLSKTRQRLSDGLSTLFLGQKALDDRVFEQLELALIQADVGVSVTQNVLAELTKRASRGELTDTSQLKQHLLALLTERLQQVQAPLHIEKQGEHPMVLLVVGVNGAGKTTTIGKIAHQLQRQGQKVLLAAGDTFRAAAIEQLQVWGERNQIPVVAQKPGSDSASVIFDALSSAKARHIDVVIADTAGRLHTQNDLMRELEKVTRVIQKFDASAPHETLLVLDGSTGQNAIHQAKAFTESVGVTGVAMTKLDGSAKGGALFAVAEQVQKPIRYIGVGEGIEDLQVFDAKAFVEALLG